MIVRGEKSKECTTIEGKEKERKRKEMEEKKTKKRKRNIIKIMDV